MWFLAGLIVGAVVGFLIPCIALQDICIECQELQQRLSELEARDSLLREGTRRGVDLWILDHPVEYNRLPEPSRN